MCLNNGSKLIRISGHLPYCMLGCHLVMNGLWYIPELWYYLFLVDDVVNNDVQQMQICCGCHHATIFKYYI